MLTAKTLPAIVVNLGKEGNVAVFLKQGTSWNGLTEYRCIAPATLAGGKMVTADKGSRHHFSDMFAKIAGLEAEPLEVVICCHRIENALQDAEDDFAAIEQAKGAKQAQKAEA